MRARSANNGILVPRVTRLSWPARAFARGAKAPAGQEGRVALGMDE